MEPLSPARPSQGHERVKSTQEGYSGAIKVVLSTILHGDCDLSALQLHSCSGRPSKSWIALNIHCSC